MKIDMEENKELYIATCVGDDIRLTSCHDCPHWQDGDEGPQCEYPDCPPCNGE